MLTGSTMKTLASYSKSLGSILSASVLVSAAHAAAFTPLGDLPGGDTFSNAFDLSADGSTVLGASSDNDGGHYFRWRMESGFSLLPEFDVQAFSPDGSIVVGSTLTEILEAALWSEASGLVPIGAPLTDPGVDPFSVAFDASLDGSIIVGVGATTNSAFSEAILWDSAGNIVNLGFLPTDLPEPGFLSFSFANAVSANGQVVVGGSSSTRHVDRGEQAFRWTQAGGMEPLGILPGTFQSQALAVSSDGGVIVGSSGSEGFRWTETSGLQAIGSFLPLAVAANGNVIVGRADTESGSVAYIWTAENGAAPLATWLEVEHGILTTGWTLSEAAGVSDDGLRITGTGLNPAGVTEAFLVSLDPATTPSSATIILAGQVNYLIIDPAGFRYGVEGGTFYNEIPGVSANVTPGTVTLNWPNLSDGAYQVHLSGIATGPYSLSLTFAHADGNSSGHTFSGKIGKDGSHSFTATITSANATDSVFAHTFADTDGDDVTDSKDAYVLSDLRPTVFIGAYNTGIKNIVLSNGASLNDLIKDLLRQSRTRADFASAMTKKSTELFRAGKLTRAEKKKLISLALCAESPNWKKNRK